MRVQVGVLVLAVVSFLAAGCVSGAEVREEQEARTTGNTQDVPLADAVCDEFCARFDSVADAVWTCDRDACDAQMTDARDLMKNAADKLKHARGTRMRYVHQTLVEGTGEAEKFLGLVKRPYDITQRATLINHSISAMNWAVDELQSLAPRPSR